MKKILFILSIFLVFSASSYAGSLCLEKFTDLKTTSQVLSLSLSDFSLFESCSVTRSGQATMTQTCGPVENTFTVTSSATVEAASCNAEDLVVASVSAHFIASIQANNLLRLLSVLIPPCETGDGGFNP